MDAKQEAVDLDAIAESMNRTHSVVDSWLYDGKKKLPNTSRLPSDYTDPSISARPARLGIGARPQPSELKGSIFENFKLKMQITGRGKPGNGGPDEEGQRERGKRPPPPPMSMGQTSRKPFVSKPLRPLDNDEESRSKSVGINKATTTNVVPSYQGKRRRKNKEV